MTGVVEAVPAAVLVVDDDDDVRRTLTATLRREGYRMHGASDATTALAELAAHPGIDLELSDLHMPGDSGLELLRTLAEQYPGVAVVMMTGDGDVTAAVECLKLGARDYLSKPLIPQEVAARVAKALGDNRAAAEVLRLRENYRSDLERQVHELSLKNRASFLAQIQMAVTMLEAKDPYTRGHSQRVAAYAVATGRQLGLDPAVLESLRLGGELHDVGKIGTRDEVLHKAGRLTDEEFVHIREHVTAGESMLSVLRQDHPDVLHITRSHHERVDGSGFPDGLRGDGIPLPARLVCVVDAFDAMTSTRAYRDGMPPAEAMAEVERCSGSQFDPAMVAAFRAAFPDLSALPIQA